MSKHTKEYHLNKAGEYRTKANQFTIKGNYDKAGEYTTLALKHSSKAKGIKKSEVKPNEKNSNITIKGEIQ